MPLYEFECDACGHRFELIRKFSDALPVCPKCGGSVHRLVSSPAFHLKGSGWYATDYGKKSGPPETSKNEKSEHKDAKDAKDSKDGKESKDAKSASTETKSTGSSDAAPAAPAPAKSSDT